MSFKKYRQTKQSATKVEPIVETTVPPELQHISENWDHHSQLSDDTRDKMNAAMGGTGRSFTTFPLVGQHHNEIDADVVEHLVHHNYQVKDYAKGIATIKKQVGNPAKGIAMHEKMVDEKIGSILDKTGASDDVKKAYMNDPARTASKGFSPTGGHHVVITHGALGISGMSTGTSWKNQSCMNQEGGAYHEKLKDDSEHGTHVAYLVHHDDLNALKYGEPDKPLARIALKPYHEEEDDHKSDTIVRPENKTYGDGNTQFGNAVSNWATDKYPAKAGVEYTKNSNVYDDTDNTIYKAVSKPDAEEAIKNGHSVVDKVGSSVDKDVIDHVIAHGKQHLSTIDPNVGNSHAFQTSKFIQNTAQIGNLNTQHVAALHKMAGDDGAALQALAVHHGDKFSTNAINNHIDRFDVGGVTNRMLMNTKLPAHVVDSLPVNKYNQVRRSMLKPQHYDKVVDSYINGESGSSYALNDHAEHFTKEHIDKLSNMTTRDAPLHVIINSKHFAQEHHDKLMNSISSAYQSGYGNADQLLKTSKFATIGDADKLKDTASYSVPLLAMNPHISSDTAINIKNRIVGGASLGSSKEHGGFNTITGYETRNQPSIPTQISKHLTPDDHKTLAESEKALNFASPEHSDKHLDAIHAVVKRADDELSAHIEKQTKHHEDNDLDEYDHLDGNDEHANHLVKKLEDHVANYARNIDNHIDNHVVENDDNYGEVGKDYKQGQYVKGHLDNIDELENYKTDNNSSRYDDQEHYIDHVSDIHARMNDIKTNTENREDHDHWN